MGIRVQRRLSFVRELTFRERAAECSGRMDHPFKSAVVVTSGWLTIPTEAETGYTTGRVQRRLVVLHLRLSKPCSAVAKPPSAASHTCEACIS